MHCNVGGLERSLRLAGGILSIGVGVFAPLSKRNRIIALSMGGLELATALTRYCPVNQALHRSSCRSHPLRMVRGAMQIVRAVV